MEDIDFKKRAVNAVWSATHMGGDAQGTTPVQQVEQNLESHIDTELDVIWEEEGDRPDEEWNRIKNRIIENIPDALEQVQEEADIDFYEKRVFEQFEELC